LVQPAADIGPRISLQSPQEIGTADGISPLRGRTGVAVFIAHAAKINRRSHSPEVPDVGSLATTRGAEVGVDRLRMIVDQHLTFGGPNCGRDSTIKRRAC